MSDNKITIGYWNLRGRIQHLRLIMSYLDVNWQQLHPTGLMQWLGKEKMQTNLEFPNLPYLIDGDIRITQAQAILLYILNKYKGMDLLGKNIRDQAMVDCIWGVLIDMITPIVTTFYNKQWQKVINDNIEKSKPKLTQLKNFIGDKDYALGYLTVIDFHIYEFSFYIERLAPQLYKQNQFLERSRKLIENLPSTKKYYESPQAIKSPFLLGEMASIKF